MANATFRKELDTSSLRKAEKRTVLTMDPAEARDALRQKRGECHMILALMSELVDC